MAPPPPIVGTHLLLDLWGVSPALLDDPEALSERLVRAARSGGATVIQSLFHTFSPQGVTGVVVLAESHIALHSWPERGFVALDVFTCGDPAMTERIGESLLRSLEPTRHQLSRVRRGQEGA